MAKKTKAKQAKTIADTLAERGSTHGDFSLNAEISQNLKDVMKEGNWEALSPMQKEALDIIVHKIARILAGNPDFPDHWHDIGGYAKLVEDRL